MGGAPQPSMQLIITGKGPLRAKFEALLKTSPLSKIDVSQNSVLFYQKSALYSPKSALMRAKFEALLKTFPLSKL